MEELERLTEIEELLYNKKKIGVKPLMKMKLKNFRILQESDYVNKLSDTLAFKVNKIINGMFTINII